MVIKGDSRSLAARVETRSAALTAMIGLIPKLTARVRFPSAAPVLQAPVCLRSVPPARGFVVWLLGACEMERNTKPFRECLPDRACLFGLRPGWDRAVEQAQIRSMLDEGEVMFSSGVERDGEQEDEPPLTVPVPYSFDGRRPVGQRLDLGRQDFEIKRRGRRTLEALAQDGIAFDDEIQTLVKTRTRCSVDAVSDRLHGVEFAIHVDKRVHLVPEFRRKGGPESALHGRIRPQKPPAHPVSYRPDADARANDNPGQPWMRPDPVRSNSR